MITHPNVKVNLGLNVLRRRPDGYHDLETLFVPYFGLQDTLEIIPADAWSETSASLFARYGSGLPAGMLPDATGAADGEDAPPIAQAISSDGKAMITVARAEGVRWDPLKDLTIKAYQLLDADYDLPAVKIFLEKTSPVGAGLGGGSADAAFALRMFSDLAGLGLSDEVLADYAARLGSDCAFFVYNEPMLARGRGEILTPFPFSLGNHTLKIFPQPEFVSTKEAYAGIVPREPDHRIETILRQPVETWKGLLVNDFEETVFAVHPRLAAARQALYDEGALYAAMSGSGSALFAIY